MILHYFACTSFMLMLILLGVWFAEKSTYGAALIANDISDLFSIDENTIKDFTLSFAFSRIVGFFLAPAMLSNWFLEICAVVDDKDREFSADAELVNWYKYWQRLSDFVYSGGVTKVCGFDPLTLEDAWNKLVILKTTDIESEPKKSPWNNPSVEEFPNKNMTKQAEEWTRRFGEKDVGKDLVKKNGYHTSAGIIIPAASSSSVRFRATITSPTASAMWWWCDDDLVAEDLFEASVMMVVWVLV